MTLSGHETNALRWTTCSGGAQRSPHVSSFTLNTKNDTCSQEGIECSANSECGCLSTSAPAGLPLNRQRYKSFPLERKCTKLQGGDTTLHQFWLSLFSVGRCISCNFRDSSPMKRHQSLQFSPMFSKINLRELFPNFPFFSALLMPNVECNTFKWQQVTGDIGNLPAS